jgi:hypothetical protein
MYPLEEVLTWEAEMADDLDLERQLLAAYRWIKIDLNDRRQTLLQEDTIDVPALQQLDEAIVSIIELIDEKKHCIEEKQREVEAMFYQWQQVLLQEK